MEVKTRVKLNVLPHPHTLQPTDIESLLAMSFMPFSTWSSRCRVQLKCDGTRRRTGGEVKGKLANGLDSQYSSHYLRTWFIQHYYRWSAHLGCQ